MGLDQRHGSVIPFAVEFDPSLGMSLCWIVVGPVEDSAFLIPFVLPKDPDHGALLDGDPWGQIDVVGDQNGVDRGVVGVDGEDEALVAGTIVVVIEEFDDTGGEFDHLARSLGFGKGDEGLL